MGSVRLICRVNDTSMKPLLVPGQRLLVSLAPFDSPLQAGDLLVTRDHDGRLVVHRMIGRRGENVITKGDNRLAADPPWSQSEVWGRVVAAEGHSGAWNSPRGWTSRVLAAFNCHCPRKATRMVQFLLNRWAWVVNDAALSGQREVDALPVNQDSRWEIQKLGEEWAVYDTQSQAVHILNRSAQIIWQKCRDGLDKQQILDEMKHTYPEISSERLSIDLEETLCVLEKAQLI